MRAGETSARGITGEWCGAVGETKPRQHGRDGKMNEPRRYLKEWKNNELRAEL